MTSSAIQQFIAEIIRHRAAPQGAGFIHVGPLDPDFFSLDYLRAGPCSAVLLEPLREYFDPLAAAAADIKGVVALPYTLAWENGEQVLYRFRPQAVTAGLVPAQAAALRAFSLEGLMARAQRLGAVLPAEHREVLRDLVDKQPSACMTVETVLLRHGLDRPDLLVVRAPGCEMEILDAMDWAARPVAAVLVDGRELTAAETERVARLMRDAGYFTLCLDGAITALRPEGRRVAPDTAGMIAAARRLTAAGDAAGAQAVLDGIAVLDLDRDQLLARTLALCEAGRLPEALADLDRARRMGPIDGEYRQVTMQAFGKAAEQFNVLVATGRAAESWSIIAPMAEIASHDADVNRQAMLIGLEAGPVARAARYAERIGQNDPSFCTALQVLASYARAIGDRAGERIWRTFLALRRDPSYNDLLTLTNLHDLAGLLLCGDLGSEELKLLEFCRTQADSIAVPAGDRLETFYSHYKLLLHSVRFDAEPAGPAPLPRFTDCRGAALGVDDLRRTIGAHGVRALVVVAGDIAYVRQYAKLFACSALMNADAPILVLVHVIGGAGRMEEIAAELAIDSPLLAYSYDDFDEAAVTTQCFSAPMGVYAKPVAHFQCIRFAVADALLHHLERPVFVSDIDSIVQHGLKAILEREAEADVVLNINRSSMYFGGRITANLLLYYPTPVARRFSGILNTYLARQLAEPMVTRWIDQVGLTMAWHAIRMAEPQAKLADFARHDINNRMFAVYEDTPFAFLSLFAGFQMDSLPERYQRLVS